MLESIKDFITTGDNSDKLIWMVLGILLGFLIKDLLLNNLVKLLKWMFGRIFKLIATSFSTFILNIKKKIRRIKKECVYRKTIKQIENREIEIPDYFLFGESVDKNPELRKIFQMIEDGIIKSPKTFTMENYFKNIHTKMGQVNLKTHIPPTPPPNKSMLKFKNGNCEDLVAKEN